MPLSIQVAYLFYTSRNEERKDGCRYRGVTIESSEAAKTKSTFVVTRYGF